MATFDELTSIIRARPGEEVTLVVERDGQELTKVVTLAERRPDSAERVGFLGIGPAYADEKVGALSGVQESFTEFGRITAGVGRPAWPRSSAPSGMRELRQPAHRRPSNADPNQRLLSPVGAVEGRAPMRPRPASADFVLLLAAINIFVGLFNLIPLLPFDGGHIAIATYEADPVAAGQALPGRHHQAAAVQLRRPRHLPGAVVVGNFYLDIFRLVAG